MTDSDANMRPLGDRYEVGDLVGRGGMADVRAGRDTRLGRQVAIKLLRSDLAADETFQERFRREAQSAASLNHPSIVAVYDTGEAPDDKGDVVPYIVMELVEGRTLRDVLRDGRKILPERALSLTADILAALDYSHRAGIIHRDIKPANVMLTPEGKVKVMDFGIARAIADTSSAMTQTAAVIGTAQYLSPEQARGETVDARSDIYSTGCVLYELLTGRPPFVGDSPVSVAYQHVREEARPPSQLNPDVSVPQVTGLDVDTATNRLESKNLVVGDTTERTSADIPEGQVMETDPPNGTTVDEGTSVNLVVSAGPELVAIPDLTSYSFDEAKELLEGDRYGLKVDRQNTDSDQPKGRVLNSNPPPGEQVERGSTITLIVSRGEVEVPNVVNQNVNAARSALEDLGLKVTVQNDTSGTAPDGTVTSQSREAGSMVPPGTTITLTVSRPAPPTTPAPTDDVPTDDVPSVEPTP